jgi:hypothetical protein
MFDGQVNDNGCELFTVTVKVQEAVAPAESVAVHVTVVVPIGKVEPEAGEHATVAPAQLSVAVGAV